MSLDRSLRTKGSMTGKRSVLNRGERIARQLADKKFDPKKQSPLGLPKTLVGKQ
jgi:small basic protein (TIGR04137 family)